jgi:L-seryl-tRNA(Ser) seleniumtransferase
VLPSSGTATWQAAYDAGVNARSQQLSALPRVDALVAAAPALVARYGTDLVTNATRAALETVRAGVVNGTEMPSAATIVEQVAADLALAHPGPPRRVINAAGVIVHTNLGRAPLSDAAHRAMTDAAGYCDVEYDLTTGRRGSRNARLQPLLTGLTGAEAATAVNNGAAALVLALAAVAGGRQVVVSRGELVEIGGSFRLPEIMAAAGVRLLEVGTTNRTRATDYAAGDDVAAILKVHPSNYEVSGFVASPDVAELAAVARRRQVPLLHDIGSGLLRPHRVPGLEDEPDAATSLAAGADLVVCSGDKLLGGPQAGLLLGRAALVQQCATSPLARALRLDKVRLAALIATLESHARGTTQDLPVWAAVAADHDALALRVRALAERVSGSVVEQMTLFGGGSAPGRGVASPVVRLDVPHPEGVAAALREGDPPVVVRVSDGSVFIDLRTVRPPDDDYVGCRVRDAVV